MLVALRNERPDRVPICPDISNMIPARLTGRPFWDIYLYDNPPLGEAYLQAVQRFDVASWYTYGYVPGGNAKLLSEDSELCFLAGSQSGGTMIDRSLLDRELQKQSDRIVERQILATPYGPLKMTTVYPRERPPWPKEKQIKDINSDWPKVKYYLGDRWEYDSECVGRDKIGNTGVYALTVDLPIDWWNRLREGGFEQVIMDLCRNAAQMRDIFDFYFEFALTKLQAYLDSQPDEIVFQGSSSSLSIMSPTLYRKYNLPFLKKATEMCKEAGVISHAHVCGRSREVVKMNYQETELMVQEPLERAPGGDVDLAEVKEKYGDRLALKGNVNTFQTLCKGSPDAVRQEVKDCIEAAAEGGGFILSTGDQVAGDTPIENLEAFVEAGKEFGLYE